MAKRGRITRGQIPLDMGEFSKWFGKSQAIDPETGAPLVLYHGRLDEVAELPQSFEAGKGIFLTDSPDVADIFRYPREYGELITEQYDEAADEFVEVEPGPRYEVHARIENPLVLDANSDIDPQRFVLDTALQSRVIREAIEAGYDGIIVRGVDEGVGDNMAPGNTYVVFDPSQVKSAEVNTGAYDPANPELEKAKGGKVNVTIDELRALAESIKAQQRAIKELDLRLTPEGDVRLETIAANPAGTGAGTAAMEELLKFLDANELRAVLSLADKGHQPLERGPKTTSRNRLRDFYRRFDFVSNRGRNKDYQLSIYDSMYRKPKKPVEKAKGGRVLDALRTELESNPAFQQYIEGSQMTEPVFHGAGRLDRLIETPGLDPKRSTSGPMPFFTASPEVASSYATKKSDTSFEHESYDQWFKYKPKGRPETTISSLWRDMTPQQRAEFNKIMPRLFRDEDTGEIVDSGDPSQGMATRGTYEHMLQEHRGNGIRAARDLWLDSAALFDDEHVFMDVLRKAGAPLENVEFIDVMHGQGGVLPAFISAKNPLVTSQIPPEVVEALEEAAETAPAAAEHGMDPWDKTTRDPQHWIDELKAGMVEGGNTGFVWTSIPDWVTNTLRRLGYDSIHDVGGKLGGEEHDVWIPFEPQQVKSAIGNRGTFDPTDPDLSKAKGGRVNLTALRKNLLARKYALSKQWYVPGKPIGLGLPPEQIEKLKAEWRRLDALDQKLREQDPVGYLKDEQQEHREMTELFNQLMQLNKDDFPPDTKAKGGRVKWGTKLGQQMAELRALQKGLPLGEAAPSGEHPSADWTARDLQDTAKPTPESILKDYGRGKGNVYMRWVRPADLPTPTGSGIEAGRPTRDPTPINEGEEDLVDADIAGYDWDEFSIGRNRSYPPLKVRVDRRGRVELIDGNHRLAWWADMDYVPAYVIDERAKVPYDEPDGGYAKGGKVRTAIDQLREYAASLAPQRGFFSTLDELVQQAPFASGTIEQWRGYLKPGRMVTREGVQSPLKQEELDYAFDKPLQYIYGAEGPGTRNLTKEQILETIRRYRPTFNVRVGTENSKPIEDALADMESGAARNVKRLEQLGDFNAIAVTPETEGYVRSEFGRNRVYPVTPLYGPSRDTDSSRLSHQSPGSEYEESITGMEGLNTSTHFDKDTLSWSRTSRHRLPSGERLKLIEEIQSDLHETAAERVGDVNSQSGLKEILESTGLMPKYRQAEAYERDLYDQRTAINRRLDENVTPEEYARLVTERHEITKAIEQSVIDRRDIVTEAADKRPRRGYRDPARIAELKELSSRLADNKVGDEMRGFTYSPDAASRRLDVAMEIGKENLKPPDAPFKSPSDYGRLELRKQLLDAANAGDDYLAMVRGEDQMARYGMTQDDEAAEGMQYIYDQLYMSEMKKLARQFGAEIVEVPVNVSTGADIRPQSMRDAGAEDYREFMDMVARGDVMYGSYADDPTLNLIYDLHREGAPKELADRAQYAYLQYKKAGEAGEDTSDELMDHDETLGALWYDHVQRHKAEMQETATYPALKLTPEIREKIKRVGVPLWSAAAGAMLLGEEEEEQPAPAEYAKGGKVRSALDELREYSQSLAPQLGFFSTLDELAQQAPFERASAEQWRGFLKPGRMLTRDGVQFPLKKEELEYALEPALERLLNPRRNLVEVDPNTISREQILKAIRQNRPQFRGARSAESTAASVDAFARTTARHEDRMSHPVDRYGPMDDPRLSHQSPESTYQESPTYMAGLDFPGHFTDNTLSWARTSSHQLPSGEKMRLVEEIQSDLHENAAERVGNVESQQDLKDLLERRGNWENYNAIRAKEAELYGQNSREGQTPERNREIRGLREEREALVSDAFENRPRRGYRTEEEENMLRENQGTASARVNAEQKPPDAPFKDPAEYALLELRKQLLNAVENGEDYLAIVRGRDQMERYGMDENGLRPTNREAAGMQYIYDEIYPSVLRKIAKQYGAEIVEIEAPVASTKDVRMERLQRLGIETTRDFHEFFGDGSQFVNNAVHHGMTADEPLGTLESIARQVDPDNTTNWKQLGQYIRTNAVPEQLESPDYAPEIAQAWDDLVTGISYLVDQAKGTATQSNKSFPALKLTPEVRERIKRIGVPLWTVGAGALLLGEGEEEMPKYAEGGGVLAELKDTAKRIGHGFATQWTGLDEQGVPRGAIYRDWDAPRDQWETEPETGTPIPPMRTVRPGMVDELMSLPDLFTFGHGPAWSKRAGERSQALDEALRARAELSPPKTWGDYIAESGGVMGAQIPVPATGAPKIAQRIGAGVPKAIKRLAKIPGAAVEWFSPTISPTLGNYAVGTGAGAVITKLLPELVQEFSNDPWTVAARAAKAYEEASPEERETMLPPELAFEIANYLDPQSQDELTTPLSDEDEAMLRALLGSGD